MTLLPSSKEKGDPQYQGWGYGMGKQKPCDEGEGETVRMGGWEPVTKESETASEELLIGPH